MAKAIIPPLNIRAAVASLEDIVECRVVEGLSWESQTRHWLIKCSITIPTSSDFVPNTTEWYVLIDESYPWGRLEFLPSKSNGLVHTFQHQNHNGVGPKNLPWRLGKLCLDTGIRTLGRHGYDNEPFEATHRLRWHMLRALDWLNSASAETLVAHTDAYELPHYPDAADSKTSIAFDETSATLAAWNSIPDRFGYAELVPLRTSGTVLAIKEFRSPRHQTLLVPKWRTDSVSQSRSEHIAAWLRLERAPILAPWQTPETWGELRDSLKLQSLDLDVPLETLLGGLRDGRPHHLLLGFPIPETMTGSAVEMHWQAILMPIASNGSQTRRGFRPHVRGQWLRDRSQIFADKIPIHWVKSGNWTHNRIIARGSVGSPLLDSNIAVLGAGALGSAVAEILVRTGVTKIGIIDPDTMEPGNLCRHTLLSTNVRQNKALGLAERLRAINPHVEVTSIADAFSRSSVATAKTLANATMLIDCTANDTALHELGLFHSNHVKHFASLSIGHNAKRLYCFVANGSHFPTKQFRRVIQPWLMEEQGADDAVGFIREGVGCWHPLFPARSDDIWLLASTAIKALDYEFQHFDGFAKLIVFEQHYDAGFSGLTRVEQEVLHV